MAKYGWRDGAVKAKKVVADALELNVTTTGTAATGTTAYIPITVNGEVFYVKGDQ